MASPFVHSAPESEASFLSLPFIEELMHYHALWRRDALHADGDHGTTDTTNPHSADTASVVRSRMQTERLYERHYYDFPDRHVTLASARAGASHQTDTAACPPMPSASPTVALEEDPATALLMLRTGLCRALGLPSPDPTLYDEDLLLQRRRCNVMRTVGEPPSMPEVPLAQLVAMSTVDEPRAPKPLLRTENGYVERDSDDLQQAAAIEWFEDALGFIAQMSFSALQARCVLLDAAGLFEALDSLPLNAMEDDVRLVLSTMLQDMLCSQTCPVPTAVLDRKTERQMVTRDVPDPELVRSLEHKMDKPNLSKKQVLAIKEQIAHVPLVQVTTVDSVVVETEREVAVGPYFSMVEAAAVLDHLTTSILSHWRLIKWTLGTQQSKENREVLVLLEDVDTFCVPPLKEFIPLYLYTTESDRCDIWEEARTDAERDFVESFVTPVARLKDEELLEHAHLREAKIRADSENRANALSAEDYNRVELAYNTRLRYAIRGTTLQEDACPLPTATLPQSPPPSPPAVAFAPTPPSKRLSGMASKRGRGSKSVQLPPILPLIPATSIELNPEASVFRADNVVSRIEAVSAQLEAHLVIPTRRKEKNQGGGVG